MIGTYTSNYQRPACIFLFLIFFCETKKFSFYCIVYYFMEISEEKQPIKMLYTFLIWNTLVDVLDWDLLWLSCYILLVKFLLLVTLT